MGRRQRTGSHLGLVRHPLVMPHSQEGQAGHATQQHPLEGSKQQAGSIHKPCPPLKTNHCAKRDWVVASAGPSVTPFQRARQQQPAWAEPAPLPLYPRDTHCNEIALTTELFRATLSVGFIITCRLLRAPNFQISSSHLPPGFFSGCFGPVISDLICL